MGDFAYGNARRMLTRIGKMIQSNISESNSRPCINRNTNPLSEQRSLFHFWSRPGDHERLNSKNIWAIRTPQIEINSSALGGLTGRDSVKWTNTPLKVVPPPARNNHRAEPSKFKFQLLKVSLQTPAQDISNQKHSPSHAVYENYTVCKIMWNELILHWTNPSASLVPVKISRSAGLTERVLIVISLPFETAKR